MGKDGATVLLIRPNIPLRLTGIAGITGGLPIYSRRISVIRDRPENLKDVSSFRRINGYASRLTSRAFEFGL